MDKRKEKTLKEDSIFSRTQKEPPRSGKAPRTKATFYLHSEDILAIDYIQIDEFKKSGKKPERSEIVSKAVQLLRKQMLG